MFTSRSFGSVNCGQVRSSSGSSSSGRVGEGQQQSFEAAEESHRGLQQHWKKQHFGPEEQKQQY